MSIFFETNLAMVCVVTMLAVISPGPDFAIIVRNGILHGRKLGLATALGIACGVTVHVTYTLLGLGYIVATYSWVLGAIKYGGAAYLIWLGISAFLPQKSGEEQSSTESTNNQTSLSAAFRNGFLCNALNPKTVLFFVALFTQVVGPEVSMLKQMGIGVFISAAHLLWFSFVVFVLTDARMLKVFNRCKGTVEKIVGACLFGLGLKLVLSEG